MDKSNTLIVIAGPTAVGKTTFAIELANTFNTEIISADSRQFYENMNIGTAKPTSQELQQAKHHLIGNLSMHDNYNVSQFENDVLGLLEHLFDTKKNVIMVGGSGLYIDAVCKGIDYFPDPEESLRKELLGDYNVKGLEYIQNRLKELDPEYYAEVDLKNPKRILRAIEVCISSGEKYSKFRKGKERERPFSIKKICLNRERSELFERISLRVDQMIEDGLVEEVKSLLDCKELNALNTVGYKEIFQYLDNNISLDQALTDIKTNTRRYAKRQLTWFKKDKEYHWFTPNQIEAVIEIINADIDKN